MSIFKDDNDEIHQAQFMRDWPLQSPELNPTESLQDVLELTLHCLASVEKFIYFSISTKIVKLVY